MELNLMTPYELGELRKKDALPHLVVYLNAGGDNDKRLAASAIIKLVEAGVNCYSALPFLIKNINNARPQVRQYTMKALSHFHLEEKVYEDIKRIAFTDEKEYNQIGARELLAGAGILLGNDTPSEYDTGDTAVPGVRIEEKGFVYFIQEDFSGRIKIGKTKNMEQRWDTFNVKLPFNIELVHVIESQNHHYTEKLFHVFFSDRQTNGEWFELSDQDIEWIKSNRYTKKINDSLTSEHVAQKKNRVNLASDKQATFLSTLLNSRNAILMKPLNKLSVEEASSLISYFYRGDEISDELYKMILFLEAEASQNY